MMLVTTMFATSLLISPALRPATTTRAAIEMAERYEVCLGKYCSKKGSKRTLATLQELTDGRDDVIVCKADMSHTELGCFDECMMGPNVRIGGEPKQDGGRIINGVKGEAACAELLAPP